MFLVIDLEEDGPVTAETVRVNVAEAIDMFRKGNGLSAHDDEGMINSVEVYLVEPDAFIMSDWQYEVANGDTRLGYFQWLVAKLEL